jgi:hypothetical protein
VSKLTFKSLELLVIDVTNETILLLLRVLPERDRKSSPRILAAILSVGLAAVWDDIEDVDRLTLLFFSLRLADLTHLGVGMTRYRWIGVIFKRCSQEDDPHRFIARNPVLGSLIAWFWSKNACLSRRGQMER